MPYKLSHFKKCNVIQQWVPCTYYNKYIFIIDFLSTVRKILVQEWTFITTWSKRILQMIKSFLNFIIFIKNMWPKSSVSTLHSIDCPVTFFYLHSYSLIQSTEFCSVRVSSWINWIILVQTIKFNYQQSFGKWNKKHHTFLLRFTYSVHCSCKIAKF